MADNHYRCDRCGAATFTGRCAWCDTARETASSAPATASKGATLSDSVTDSVTSSDGERGLSDEWSEERRTEHFYRQYGRTFSGYGPSMDPHRCGDPDEECWTVTESRRVTPWEVVGDE